MTGQAIGPLRIGLIGAGRFGRTLAEVAATVPDLKVTAVFDIDHERAWALERDLGGADVRACRQLTQMWPIVDAVLISSSHDQHMSNVIEAASAGKHVFCEKPMAIDVAECQAMIEATTKHGVKMLVGQVTRLMPIMARMREILDSGLIGRPVAIHILRAAWMERQGWWAKTASSGGMLHSPGAHIYDLLNSLLGRAVSMYAVAAPRIQPQVDFADTLFTTVTYENGAIATFGTSISGQTWLYEGRIIAERGSLQYALEHEGCWLTYHPRGATPIRELFGTFDQEGLDGVAVELRNFADFVLRDAPPFVTNHAAMEAVAMIQAAYQSVQTGGVVHLPVKENLRVR
jgi:predicted dehydrogenase